MTTQEYIKRQHDKINLLKSGIAIGKAAQDTHVKMTKRIFEEGETAQGNKLGYNSTDPLYVNPETQSPKKFPTKGKNGNDTFKSGKKKGKKHVTGYFDSYKDFRQTLGLESGFMNLNLTNIFHSDFGKGVVKLEGSAYVSTVTQEANKGKLEKFETYFKLNNEERENFKEVLEDETLEILKVI
jgi:hypothetical protein